MCPKCGAEITKQWVNKRKQRMGKCAGCGKMVYLGKAEQQAGAETGKQAAPPQKNAPAKTAKRGPSPAPHSGSGRASSATAKRDSLFGRVRAFLNTDL